MKRFRSLFLLMVCGLAVAAPRWSQDKKADEIAAKRGLRTGFAASLEFRQFVASHSDTYAAGPMTAAELVAQAAK